MLIALDENGNRVSADDAQKGVSYHCQCCNESVILRQGSVVRAHYAHKANSDCAMGSDGMSEWHIEWQNTFGREYCEKPVIFDANKCRDKYGIEDAEYSKDGIHKRIADVLINDTCVEFQHSSISIDEVWLRTAIHHNCNNRILWVVDCRDKIDNFSIFSEKYVSNAHISHGGNMYIPADTSVWQCEWRRAYKWLNDLTPSNDTEIYLQIKDDVLLKVYGRLYDLEDFLLYSGIYSYRNRFIINDAAYNEDSYKYTLVSILSKQEFIDYVWHCSKCDIDGVICYEGKDE